MQTNVRICGVDYTSCEQVQEGEYWGIKTPEKTFWLFPICNDEGREITSRPPFLPVEIRAVTNEPPDLTAQHPEAVKELFDRQQTYFARTTTYQQYLADNPNLFNPPTEEEFKAGRERILVTPLADFARGSLTRQLVWEQHGTQELADQCGYLGAVYEAALGRGGDQRRATQRMDVAQMLFWKLKEANRKLTNDAAWATVNQLRYVMIYKDVPTQRFIYLEGMKEAAHPPRRPDPVLAVDVRVNIQAHSIKEFRLIVPGWEEALKTIERSEGLVEKLRAAAGEVRKATEIGDLYSNPSMADAKNAAIKQEVPKEFVAYCHNEMHARRFPSTDQAHKAVETQSLFRALRDPETPSRSTVWRWWRIVRNELESRGLLQPRGKGPAAQKASHYDVEKHGASMPEKITLDEAEQEQERGGRTNHNAPGEESHDPQDTPSDDS